MCLSGCNVGCGSGVLIGLRLRQGGRCGNVIRPTVIDDNFGFVALLREPGCESSTDRGLVLLVCQRTDLVTKYLDDVYPLVVLIGWLISPILREKAVD